MNNFEKFKGRGPFRTEIAIVAVLAIIIFLLLVVPRFDRDAEIVEETTIYFLESVEIPQVDLKDMNIPAPEPVIPVMSEDPDFDLSVTLEDMDFENYQLSDDPPPPKDPEQDILNTVVFVDREVEPVPVGGYQAILDNVEYPESAKEIGIEGTVVVQCYIDKRGDILKTVIMKGMPGTGLDEAARSALEKTKFKPAIQRDKPVGVWIAIPIIFKLN